MERDETHDDGRIDDEHTDAGTAVDTDGSQGATALADADRVAVPVFYTIPEIVADRAISRFRDRLNAHRAGDVDLGDACLRGFVYDEINEQPVIYVGDTPLGEYASGRVPVRDTAQLERGEGGCER